MKAKIIEKSKLTEDSYPILKEMSDAGVVLFIAPNTGVVIEDGDVYNIGDYSDEWDEDEAVVFNGIVELSND
ncbi:MAG: hypothetical protein ACO3HJ_00005, partial [Methylophilaceae bacterium]